MGNPVPKPVKREKAKYSGARRRSKKRAKQEREYLQLRNKFLQENPICAVTGELATQCHHRRGRIGYLLTAVEWFLPVSAAGHRKIEENPKWGYSMGYSLKR